MSLFEAIFKYPPATYGDGKLVFLSRIPGEVRLLKDLPRNAAGKIDKLTLREGAFPTTSS